MQTLTPQELETARTLRLQGKSTDEVYNYIAANRVGAPSRLSAARQERVVSPSTGQDILGDVMDFGRGVGQAFKRVVPEVREAFTTPEIDTPSRIGAAALDVAQVPLDIAGEAIIGAGKVALPQSTEESISRTFTRGVQGAMESEFAQNTMDWYEQQTPQTQFRLREILLPGAEVAAEIGSGGVLGKLFSRGRRQATGDIAEELQNVAREAETGNIAPANRVVQSTIDDAERERIVTDFTNAYQNSLVENRTAINRQLDKLADQSSFGELQLSRDLLIRNLAEEGYIPAIDGRLAKFDNTFADIENRQDRVMQALMPVLENTRTTVQIEDFFEQVRQSLRTDARVGSDINVALQRIDALEEGARANYGETLSAVDINRLKIEGNQKRGDIGRASSDPVVTDVWSNVARTANQWIDQNVPDNAGKRANAEWARLQRIKDTAQILNNQQVDVGIFGRALGSYITTVLGSTAGLSVAGPGGLVIAGVLSNIGADTLANLIRNRTFNPKVAEQVRNVMRQDDELVEDLIRTANDQDTEIIRRFLLPAADPNAPRSQVGSGAPIQAAGETPSGRVEPGITERTREGSVRQPEGEATPTLTEQALVKLRDAGIEPEDVQKAIAAGVGGYLLMTYMDEQGILLPAGLVMLSAMPSGSRQQVITQASKLARDTNKTLKLPDNVADEVLRSLNEESAITKGMRAGDDVDADDVMRLDTLRNKSKAESLTDEELVEAGVLMEKYGDQFPDFSPSATTKTTDLLEEARKYDNPTDFINAQKDNFAFHGTPFAEDIAKSEIRPSKSGNLGEGLYLSRDKNTAREFTKLQGGGKGSNYEDTGNGLYTEVSTGEQIQTTPGVFPYYIGDLNLKKLPDGVEQSPDFAKQAMKEGYDGVDASNSVQEPQVVIFPDAIKKMRGLQDMKKIWEQSQ